MPNKMLIDASHPEETRVVVLRGNRVEEFDFESASRKPLRGNIYLAKVTRVEPSLQAAFIEYGGNRHGFLAFSEIHPDYYQIPVADRQALLEEEARHEEEDDEEEEQRPRRSRRRRRDGAPAERRNRNGNEQVSEIPSNGNGNGAGEPAADEAGAAGLMIDAHPAGENAGSPVGFSAETDNRQAGEAEPEAVVSGLVSAAGDESPAEPPPADLTAAESNSFPQDAQPSEQPDRAEPLQGESDNHAVVEHETAGRESEARSSEHDEEDDEDEDEEEEHVEQIGGDALEEAPRRKPRLRRHYKIQEVIKRRQVLLVQVVKEERGNKGAALTTYLSLAGRYSVLMPNTARGGGISRKITDTGDRKRLKSIVQDLDVPEGMGIILRTAGASRTRGEVNRDFGYLLRMWENVRELTLRSAAPTLVYEEGSLIKRAIRDLYNKDIDEVTVAGDVAWREARDFMRLIMPSHARSVVPWREPQPIFVRCGVETQLDALFSNHVTLRSGGYLVINQTEALVAIDVNSGRSTREHNIEDTALRTNLEASDEIARQLRLRDLAGLIVVDFIDMEENRNNRSVERRLKDALKDDRARIQVGRISHFGLLEMSRQRIRTGVLEGSTAPCPHCAGSGSVRSMSSVALHVLRVLEDALTKSSTHDVIVRTRTDVALYILNQKRAHLREIEGRFGVHASVEADETLPPHVYHALERGELASGTPEPFVPPAWEPDPVDEIDFAEGMVAEEAESVEEVEEIEDGAVTEAADERESEAEGEDGGRRRRRRRRRRGGRGERETAAPDADAPQPSDEGLAATVAVEDVDGHLAGHPAGRFTDLADEAVPSPDRDGFWARERNGEAVPFHVSADDAPAEEASTAPLNPAPSPPTMEHYAEGSSSTADSGVHDGQPLPEPAPSPIPDVLSQSEQPIVTKAAPVRRETVDRDKGTSREEAADRDEAPAQPVPVQPPREPTEVVITQADPAQPKRGGWWQRAKSTLGGG